PLVRGGRLRRRSTQALACNCEHNGIPAVCARCHGRLNGRRARKHFLCAVQRSCLVTRSLARVPCDLRHKRRKTPSGKSSSWFLLQNCPRRAVEFCVAPHRSAYGFAQTMGKTNLTIRALPTLIVDST